MKKVIIIILIFFSVQLTAQDKLLNAGPMVGYSQMREVALWVQTTVPAKVQIKYWDKKNKSKIFKTDSVITKKHSAFTAHLIADKVEPGRKYEYELFINDKLVKRPYPLEFQSQDLWQYHHDPPNFTFAFGSGAYVNQKQYDRPKPYGGDYEIYTSIYKKHPDFMLWGGDNVYLREADYYSRTGILARYTYHQSLPELQPLFGSVHNYAIWDDHDYGPDNSDRSFINKDLTLEAFKLFWANPSYGVMDKPGTTTFFKWNDVDFFLLDDRYYRSPDNRENTRKVEFGEDQIEWLMDALSFSKAPFKIIVTGGQILNPLPEWETYSMFPEEKNELLNKIKAEGITGVVFLTGDRHFTEISKMKRHGTYPLYDFTISAFTSGANSWPEEPNFYRIKGTHIFKRNFVVFSFTGKRKHRVMTCTTYDVHGKKIWDFSLKADELK